MAGASFFFTGIQTIANTVDGSKMDRRANGLQTAAEKMDIIVEIAFLHFGAGAPYLGENLAAGQGPVRIAQKEF